MYSFIRGRLFSKKPTNIIVDVSGIGFEIFIPTRVFEILPKEGEEVFLYTYYYVKEDIHRLYGFLIAEDRDFFKLLISISGIGPSQALNILSSIDSISFIEYIKEKSVEKLVKIPGIGKKKAEKIIFELNSKIKDLESIYEEIDSVEKEKKEDLILALSNLGYQKGEINKVLKILEDDIIIMPIEELVKKALNLLLEL